MRVADEIRAEIARAKAAPTGSAEHIAALNRIAVLHGQIPRPIPTWIIAAFVALIVAYVVLHA